MLCCSVPEPAGAAARGPRLCEVRRPDPPQVRLRPGRQDIVQVQYSIVQLQYNTVQYRCRGEDGWGHQMRRSSSAEYQILKFIELAELFVFLFAYYKLFPRIFILLQCSLELTLEKYL